MAKAGSGDVLAGIIASFLAQGCETKQAAIIGCYLHGLCGTLCAKEKTVYGVIASDLIEALPQSLKYLLSYKK